jgi:hypothetical protein
MDGWHVVDRVSTHLPRGEAALAKQVHVGVLGDGGRPLHVHVRPATTIQSSVQAFNAPNANAEVKFGGVNPIA